MLEEQIDTNTADRQLLYDIRSEMRTNNTLLTQLLEVLRPIAKDTVPKAVKPKPKVKPKSKEAKPNDTKSSRGPSGGNPRRNSAKHPGKRQTVSDK